MQFCSHIYFTTLQDIPYQIIGDKVQLSKKIPKEGDSTHYQNDGVTVSAWNNDDIAVLAHTNRSSPSEDGVFTWTSKKVQKQMPRPQVMENFSNHIFSIQKHDNLRENYCLFGRASNKRWKCIRNFIIDSCRYER